VILITRLIDARTSQNASYANSISEPILLGVPELFGRVVLLTQGATGFLRTQINGTVTVQLPLLPVTTTVTITVVRGLEPTDLVVYSASEALDLSILGPQVISFTASDFRVPIPANNRLAYTAFVSANVIGTIRVGPESFNAAVYSDQPLG
jgi:hypothetical protein